MCNRKEFNQELADSTNVERPGFSIPESTVFKNMEEIIKNTKGRLIVGTFASQIERIAKVIELAEKYNKKIVIDGHSMKINVEIARIAKALTYKKESIVPTQNIDDYPPEKNTRLSNWCSRRRIRSTHAHGKQKS